MISFACPACGKQLEVQDELAGKKVKCPGCGQAITVPLLLANRGDPPTAEEAKRGEEKKGLTTLTKVLATVFGAVIAPVLVAVLVKWADPSLWRTQPTHDTPQAGSPSTQPAPIPTPSSVAAPERPSTFTALPGGQALFNGKDLTGWVTADGKPGNWRVQDGLLTCVGPPSYLYTVADDWGDFHLRVEAKVNQGGASGVFFRVNRPFKHGQGYAIRLDRQKTGTLNGLVPVNESPVRPDVWFTLDVTVRGRQVQVQVDGKTVVDYTDVQNNRLKGHIALEHLSLQTKVFFRHIEAQRGGPLAGQGREVVRPAGQETASRGLGHAGRKGIAARRSAGRPESSLKEPSGRRYASAEADQALHRGRAGERARSFRLPGCDVRGICGTRSASPADRGGWAMRTVKYVSWEEDGAWLGYLQDFPDYWTQGETLEDLKDHLRDLYADLSGGQIPGIRRVDDLVVS